MMQGTTVSLNMVGAEEAIAAWSRPKISPEECLSTHGGSGYAAGSYWNGDAIICGACDFRIENPQPTGGKFVPRDGAFGKILFFFGIGVWKPTWNSVWRFYGGHT